MMSKRHRTRIQALPSSILTSSVIAFRGAVEDGHTETPSAHCENTCTTTALCMGEVRPGPQETPRELWLKLRTRSVGTAGVFVDMWLETLRSSRYIGIEDTLRASPLDARVRQPLAGALMFPRTGAPDYSVSALADGDPEENSNYIAEMTVIPFKEGKYLDSSSIHAILKSIDYTQADHEMVNNKGLLQETDTSRRTLGEAPPSREPALNPSSIEKDLQSLSTLETETIETNDHSEGCEETEGDGVFKSCNETIREDGVRWYSDGRITSAGGPASDSVEFTCFVQDGRENQRAIDGGQCIMQIGGPSFQGYKSKKGKPANSDSGAESDSSLGDNWEFVQTPTVRIPTHFYASASDASSYPVPTFVSETAKTTRDKICSFLSISRGVAVINRVWIS